MREGRGPLFLRSLLYLSHLHLRAPPPTASIATGTGKKLDSRTCQIENTCENGPGLSLEATRSQSDFSTFVMGEKPKVSQNKYAPVFF